MYLSSMYRLLISRILFFIFFRTNHGARNGVMNNNTKKNNNNHQCSLFFLFECEKNMPNNAKNDDDEKL